MNSIKKKNLKWLAVFLFINYILFGFVFNLNWSLSNQQWNLESLKVLGNPYYLIFIYILVIILSYIIPVNLKNIVIFWRIKNPLPGCRVFTELAPKDPRVNLHELISKYGELPINHREQNLLWYKIFKSKKNEIVIYDSHRFWLLFRDMTSMSLILLIVVIVLSLINDHFKFNLYYLIFILIQFISLSICARNSAYRFACNVLCEP